MKFKTNLILFASLAMGLLPSTSIHAYWGPNGNIIKLATRATRQEQSGAIRNNNALEKIKQNTEMAQENNKKNDLLQKAQNARMAAEIANKKNNSEQSGGFLHTAKNVAKGAVALGALGAAGTIMANQAGYIENPMQYTPKIIQNSANAIQPYIPERIQSAFNSDTGLVPNTISDKWYINGPAKGLCNIAGILGPWMVPGQGFKSELAKAGITSIFFGPKKAAFNLATKAAVEVAPDNMKSTVNFGVNSINIFSLMSMLGVTSPYIAVPLSIASAVAMKYASNTEDEQQETVKN